MVDENSWNLVTDAFDNSPLDIRVATTSNELQGQASVLLGQHEITNCERFISYRGGNLRWVALQSLQGSFHPAVHRM